MTMTKANTAFPIWAAHANAALLAGWGIPFCDAPKLAHGMDSGIETDELHRRFYEAGDTPQEAAESWAEKYDLIEFDDYERDLFKAPAQAYLDGLNVATGKDPNYGGEFLPGEAMAAGNGGTVLFCIFSGVVTRYFPSSEVPLHHDGYGDWASVDLPDLKAWFGGDPVTGEGFDVLDVGAVLKDGTVVPAEEEHRALTDQPYGFATADT